VRGSPTGVWHARTLLRGRGAVALRRGAVALWRSHAVPYCCPTTTGQDASRGKATKKWAPKYLGLEEGRRSRVGRPAGMDLGSS
jgi:hypothetical protein